MFTSSKPMMFRHLLSLQGFKLHQPLPMTPRESQQLLNLLTTSFRQQLDREHGVFRDEGTVGDVQKGGSHVSKDIRKRRASTGQVDRGSHQPTDRHLYSILTNPLFGHDLHKKNHKAELPMDVFKDGVARGIMNLESATACLKGEKNTILRSANFSVRDGMKESGAGLQVLNWLESSGIARNTAFLQNHAFVRVFFEFLVAEGLESQVWSWLGQEFMMISKSQVKTDPAHLKALAYPLYFLIKAETTSNSSLNAAYKSMQRAVSYLTASEVPARAQRKILSPAGRFLSSLTSSPEEIVRRPTSDSQAYSQFLTTIQHFSTTPAWQRACLCIYHPSAPDATPLLKYLYSQARDSSQDPAWAEEHKGEIYYILDASRLLLKEGKFKEARWLMIFLQETFPQQLGLTQDKQSRQVAENLTSQLGFVHDKESAQIAKARREASSLQLLQSLSLA